MRQTWGDLSTETITAFCLESAPRNPLLRHRLFRRVYIVCFVIFTLLVLLPAWTVIYVPRRNRPRYGWTLQRCLRVRWSRRLCGLVARCEIDYLGRDLGVDLVCQDLDPLTLSHSHPVTIPAAPHTYLLGHPAKALQRIMCSTWEPHLVHRYNRNTPWTRWARDPTKKLGFAPVKAFWYTGEKAKPEEGRGPRADDDPVMLHFHGGGYLCGTAAETDLTSSIPKALVKHTAIHHILSVDYRLAPDAPWPLPLLDAISAYHHLVHNEGVNERDIVLCGDSAGGHLALALTRWIRDEGQAVGLIGPRALVLLSPWTDVGFSNSWGAEAYTHNADSDTIDDTFGPFATSLLLRGLPVHMMHTSEYLSPASLLLPKTDVFENFPPTFTVLGGAERLRGSILVMWDRLQASRPADDLLMEMPDAVHDFMIFPWQAEQSGIVYQTLDQWLRKILATEDTDFDWHTAIAERRRTRCADLRLDRSPVMQPVRRESGLIRLMGDLRGEGMSMVDVSALDLDAMSSHTANSAREWLAPFTSQMEKGDWDWDGNWYDNDSE